MAEDEGSRLWSIKPKWHFFQELILHGPGLDSPSTFWTYADEDFVGLCSKMAHQAGGQNGPHSAGLKLLEKTMIALQHSA